MATPGPEYSPFFAVMGASAAMVFSGNYPTVSHFPYKLFVGYSVSIYVCFCLSSLH